MESTHGQVRLPCAPCIGAPKSGKTSATALITRRLEQKTDRSYVAHYFFSNNNSTAASTKRSESEISTVQSALRYMAFQIARVDATLRTALSKACDAGFRNSRPTDLDSLWEELKIRSLGSGATYYLVFDGVEHLAEPQARLLLKLLYSSRLRGAQIGRVRVLVSGTDKILTNEPMFRGVPRIRMVEHNWQDMRVIVEGKLSEWTMLQKDRDLKINSNRKRARDKIIENLPKQVKGNFSQLHLGLEKVQRVLRTRTGLKDLDQMLDQSISSRESAIKTLQQTLTVNETSELNELLKWVLFGRLYMTLEQLEAAMVNSLFGTVGPGPAALANRKHEVSLFRHRLFSVPARYHWR